MQLPVLSVQLWIIEEPLPLKPISLLALLPALIIKAFDFGSQACFPFSKLLPLRLEAEHPTDEAEHCVDVGQKLQGAGEAS